jgi:general secretion pathway protein B
MSYILDALRKADAERERDPARGIHAQPMTAAGERGPLRMPAWGLAAAAGLVALAAGAALWEREPPVVAQVVAPVAAPSPVPIAAPVTVPAPPVPTVATTVSPPAPPLLAPERTAGRTAARTAPPPPVPRATAAATPAATAPVAAPTAPAAPSAPAAPAADRIFALAELPAEVQRDLPKLTISGGVHSENAAQRMLIVGGQVLGEGAEVAPGVTLEQIRPRVAVLRFRGYRFSVGY